MGTNSAWNTLPDFQQHTVSLWLEESGLQGLPHNLQKGPQGGRLKSEKYNKRQRNYVAQELAATLFPSPRKMHEL